jgi:energy-coupling factor transporter ATP-binding protein EcfA2
METLQKQARKTTHMRQMERLARMLMHLDHRENMFPWIRLATLVAGGILTFLAFQYGSTWLGWTAIAFSLAVFLGVVFIHRRLNQKIKRCKLSLDQVTTQVSRMNLDWGNIPLTLDEPVDPHHPFECDLNLSGSRSLLHLLDTSISRGGALRLRQWLLTPAPDPDTIAKRQQLVRELAPLTGFRNHLWLLFQMDKQEKDPPFNGQPLLDWLENQARHDSLKNLTIYLGILAVINIVLFILNFVALIPPIWIITFIVYAGIYLFNYRSFRDLFDDAYDLWSGLGKFRPLLFCLEKYPYPGSSSLAELCAVFFNADSKPTRTLKKISLIASAASLQRNQLLWLPLNALLPWDLFFAYQLELCKTDLRLRLPVWLDTFYEIEALNSLANYAYLNPDLSFPEIVPPAETSTKPLMQAQELGHPLLPDQTRVCNDFTLSKSGEIAVITGSNMSGKSTFLRTLGINLVLAYSGSVVVARQFQAAPLRIFTCIHLSDSLTDGISYFYAEVRRLKVLLDALETDSPYPLFFLIDEIFRGTNHRERQEGSAAYIRALIGRHGAGVIATHDLTLAELAEQIDALHNYHFRDDVHDGRMAFDYRIRPGASPTTNALKIMKLEGLPV